MRIYGIKFKTNNNKYFLHLDKKQFYSFYGHIFVLTREGKWEGYRQAQVKDLIAILNQNENKDFIEV